MKKLVFLITFFTCGILNGQDQIDSLDNTLKKLVVSDLERSTDYVNNFKVYVLNLEEFERGFAHFNLFPIYNSDQYNMLINSDLYILIEGKPVILINSEETQQIDFYSFGFLEMTTPQAIKFAQILYPVALGEIRSRRTPVTFKALINRGSDSIK